MTRSSYVGLRLLQMIPVLFGLSALVFLLIHLVPGDPARSYLGQHAPQAAVDRLDKKWGLDQPLLTQFGHFLGKILHGDFGTSLSYNEPVSNLIHGAFGPTVWLIVMGAIFAVCISVPLAILGASKVNGARDHAVRLVPLLGLGMPSFWLAILLIYGLALGTGWFPVSGFGDTFLSHLHSMILPGLTVALAMAPFLIRSLRASLIDVQDSDYIATARAKGLPARRVLTAHAVRNAIIPAITILGLNIGWLIGNTIVIERIFALPGLGAAMLEAIFNRDFPTVQAITLVFGVMVVVVNVGTDITRSFLDPRVQLGR